MKAVLDTQQTPIGRLITVGHSTLELATLCQLLTGVGVELLVDVRRFPASESVWWRCHRRLIADVVVVKHGRPVSHLMPNGAVVPHQLAAGAWLRSDGLLG